MPDVKLTGKCQCCGEAFDQWQRTGIGQFCYVCYKNCRGELGEFNRGCQLVSDDAFEAYREGIIRSLEVK